MMWMRLLDICDFQGGSQPPKEEWSFAEQEGYIRMLQIRDFTQSEKVTPEYIKISNCIKTCTEDDVLIARYGASIGKVLTGIAGAYNVAIMRTIPDTDIIRKRFLYYYLKSSYFQYAILNVGSRAAQAGFNKTDLAKLEITCPELSKQDKIVKILEKVESIIQKRKDQLNALDYIIKFRFVEMFGDVKYGSERWGGKPFKDITINLDSKRKPVKDADRKRMQGIYPYYGATGIVDYINDYRQDGDFLLISEDGKALELRSKPIAFLASGKIWVNNHAHVQQCTDECNMIYLMYHINFMDISIWVTGIDQKKLNRANLDTIPIALPPIELQEQFAAFVHQVDKSKLLSLIKLLEQLITYLYNVFIIYRQDKGEEVEKYE